MKAVRTKRSSARTFPNRTHGYVKVRSCDEEDCWGQSQGGDLEFTPCFLRRAVIVAHDACLALRAHSSDSILSVTATGGQRRSQMFGEASPCTLWKSIPTGPNSWTCHVTLDQPNGHSPSYDATQSLPFLKPGLGNDRGRVA